MNEEFFTAVELLAKEKEISADFIYEQFRESIVKAAKRQDAEVRKQAEARRRADLRRQAFEKAELAGTLFCGGISDPGEASGKKEEQDEAYEFGRSLE